MSKPAIAVITVLAVAGTLYGLRGQPAASVAPNTAPSERAFAGKVLVITLKSDPESTLTIENPSFARSGGRDFLIGTCLDDGGSDADWREGLTVWTAMDDVSQIVELRDREELKKHIQGEPDAESRPTRA
jgi:hypothetical protein